MNQPSPEQQRSDSDPLDTTSHEQFFAYYEKESLSEETRARFVGLLESVLRAHAIYHGDAGKARIVDVADIGCGAGTQSIIWAQRGYQVHGLDISEPLIEVAHRRAATEGLEIDFRLGTATALPWSDRTMDICLLPELLEHVEQWEACLDEAARVLRANGLLVISTSNRLCPVQNEFDLPLYSWYPERLKRHFVKLAQTTRPELARYARYPAVNWFTWYSLAASLRQRGFVAVDRFDVSNPAAQSTAGKIALALIQRNAAARFAAHVCTPATLVFAFKRP
jgi:2-polyprenyl-3-methyl-5-hydroxy-6-metoxy-1,4-benzoquinol methylase